MTDAKLWTIFSLYIRLRDSDENGICKCFTCSRRAYFKKMDCGHGIGRQHKATKFDEKNNHAQCKVCNGFEGGKREEYKKEMNERYGPQTWELMEIKARQPFKWSRFEFTELEKDYKKKVALLIAEKNLQAA